MDIIIDIIGYIVLISLGWGWGFLSSFAMWTAGLGGSHVTPITFVFALPGYLALYTFNVINPHGSFSVLIIPLALLYGDIILFTTYFVIKKVIVRLRRKTI